VLVDVEGLVSAPWNYKRPNPDMIEKLAASIQHDASAGVMAVREIDGGRLEVIDGNHRLEAIKRLGWQQALVENFGAISKAQAVLIAQRRNAQWFEDDLPALSRLMRDVVIPELSLDEIEGMMPQDRRSLDQLLALADFDWDSIPERPAQKDGLSFQFDESLREMWDRWNVIALGRLGETASRSQVLAEALKDAIAHAIGQEV
jgi:hypothetical protein